MSHELKTVQPGWYQTNKRKRMEIVSFKDNHGRKVEKIIQGGRGLQVWQPTCVTTVEFCHHTW